MLWLGELGVLDASGFAGVSEKKESWSKINPKGPFTRAIFDAILVRFCAQNLPQPAYPARVYSRVTPRQNTAKLAEIRKKGVFK